MPSLTFALVLLPVLAAVGCLVLKARALRVGLVLGAGAVLVWASLALFAHGPAEYDPDGALGLNWDALVSLADFALLFVILRYAFLLDNFKIKALTVAQIVLLAFFELFMVHHGVKVPALAVDHLSLILVLVASIVGSIICAFGLPYMDRHEAHLHLPASRQPRFFFVMLLFLGAMNGLALANNILWLYFFFEVTTLCSFLLIGHDGTDQSRASAERALWMNALGGLAFAAGMVWAYAEAGTLDMRVIISSGHQGGAMLLPMALLVLAGFTKAAQLPFQSWLLGAMVAPTPVSALLHSSTMVKAGVYVVLRFAPVFAGTFLSLGLALCGAFTFIACAALAMGQSNGKKILAYSTVSNLGLILCCAGLNTPFAVSAAGLLIIFHAVSKSLLFLCVGTIEQEIGSRDIEDMRALYARMPRTAFITITGIMTMVLPPFGVLLGKWMAIEAAADNMVVVVLVALGSALSVVYWARWAGMLMATRRRGQEPEDKPFLIKASLAVLCVGAVGLSLFTPFLARTLIMPMFPAAPFSFAGGVLHGPTGAFLVYPLFALLGAGFAYALWSARKSRGVRFVNPYLGGADAGGPLPAAFVGPMNERIRIEIGNYYLPSVFGEDRLTFFVNAAALALIALMAGGALR